MQGLPIILGSSSIWRKQVLTNLGYQFTTMSPDIDEKAIRDPDPTMLTLKIANAKADALLSKVTEPSILITSDQVIVCNGVIREKPESAEQCREFLRSYSQYPAEAYSSVVMVNTKTGKRVQGTDIAKQYFHSIPEEFMEELIKQGDVLKCAGGFTIEHMPQYLSKREGEMECIMGMPNAMTKKLLEEVQ